MAVVVGRNADAVAAAAEKWGWAESATDWREVIARDDIDIVDIVTPGDSHAEIAIAALEAGKHVLCEKPLANTVEEAEAMADAAARAAERGIRSMVGLHLSPRSRGDLPARPHRRGRRRHRAAGARGVPAGLARRPRDAAGLAPAEGARGLGRAGRHRRAHHRHDAVRDRPDRRRGVGNDRHDREGTAAAGLGLRPVGHRRRRGTARSPSTTSRSSPGASRTARSSRSRRPASRRGARTRSRSRCRATRARSRSTSRTSTACSSTTAPRPTIGRASRRSWSPRRSIRTSRRGGPPATCSATSTASPTRSWTSSPAIAEGTDPHPSFAEGLSVQRVLDAVERSSENESAWVRIAAGVPASV